MSFNQWFTILFKNVFFRDAYISPIKAILVESTCYANLPNGLDLQIPRNDSLRFLQKPSHWLFEHQQYGSYNASTTIKLFVICETETERIQCVRYKSSER